MIKTKACFYRQMVILRQILRNYLRNGDDLSGCTGTLRKAQLFIDVNLNRCVTSQTMHSRKVNRGALPMAKWNTPASRDLFLTGCWSGHGIGKYSAGTAVDPVFDARIFFFRTRKSAKQESDGNQGKCKCPKHKNGLEFAVDKNRSTILKKSDIP